VAQSKPRQQLRVRLHLPSQQARIFIFRGALTGAVTLNITAPLVGSESLIYFTQGATAQTLTLSMASVVFKQTSGAGTGTGTYSVADIATANNNYCIRIFWATSTLAYVSVS